MASESSLVVVVYMRINAAQECLISILLWRLSAIDQVNDVDMAQAASQGHVCVLSVQSLTPWSLQRVAYRCQWQILSGCKIAVDRVIPSVLASRFDRQ